MSTARCSSSMGGQFLASRMSKVCAPPSVASLVMCRIRLVVSTIFGFIVAVIDTVLLWALGVPAALLWGLLAFITNYVPNIGFVLGQMKRGAI